MLLLRVRANFVKWLIGLWFIQGCAPSAPHPDEPPRPNARPFTVESAPLPRPIPGPTTSVSATTGPTGSPVPKPPGASAPHFRGPLAHFHRALYRLARKDRADHVRVVWLGDSHAQADFWTDALRQGLQDRFGNAGPGFVRMGYRNYRHAEIGIDVGGSWRMRPKQPATTKPWSDGKFGLGGILHAGYAGQRFATVHFKDEQLPPGRRLRWDLCLKFGFSYDELRLTWGHPSDAPDVQIVKTIRPNPDTMGVHHRPTDTRASQLQVAVLNGRPDFCGVTIETDPGEGLGVVLDNLGINGARYATALAWNETHWIAELAQREPELLIYEFGGNEASETPSRPAAYKKHALALIARGRKAAKDASCLVIGPSERTDVPDRIPPINDAMRAAAEESGCMFWDTYDKMGGKGSMQAWRADERGAPDGVHLKPKGYAIVGQWLLDDVLAGYDAALAPKEAAAP